MSVAARILVVEDNPSNSELLSDLLEMYGFQVDVAADAAEAFQRLGQGRPDVIIMDIQLPQMDGLEATRALKARPETRDIPVLALTALAMKGDRERILAAGCDAYLPKPIDAAHLLHTVKGLAARQAATTPEEATT